MFVKTWKRKIEILSGILILYYLLSSISITWALITYLAKNADQALLQGKADRGDSVAILRRATQWVSGSGRRVPRWHSGHLHP